MRFEEAQGLKGRSIDMRLSRDSIEVYREAFTPYILAAAKYLCLRFSMIVRTAKCQRARAGLSAEMENREGDLLEDGRSALIRN